MTGSAPVFVVGVFRSGTSLLCSILNQNPKLALMYECDVWNFPKPLLRRRFKQNWAQRIEFYNQALSRHRLVKEDNLSGLEKIRTPRELYAAFGALKGATASGEKSPFYCDRLVQLHQEHPDALFIYVWRNPVEVYRSVLKAGETSRFFGKPGMLSRMIYHQEQAIRQAEVIEKKGARIFRVDYAELVDQTEVVCRRMCDFLGVAFDAQMLQLNKADLSAIYKAPHHAYLRRGVIERQKYDRELVPPAVVRKLERFRNRWEARQSHWLKPTASANSAKPGKFEMLYHLRLGRLLTIYDSLVRAGFEFLPLAWLKVYRLMKNWVVSPPSGAVDEKTSIFKDMREHWLTILTASGLVALIGYIHTLCNPHLMFILFYSIPCVLLTLVVNTRWATVFVLIVSLLAPAIQYDGDENYRSAFVFVWNFFTRFVLLEILILTLGRIRLEFSQMSHHVR